MVIFLAMSKPCKCGETEKCPCGSGACVGCECSCCLTECSPEHCFCLIVADAEPLDRKGWALN